MEPRHDIIIIMIEEILCLCESVSRSRLNKNNNDAFYVLYKHTQYERRVMMVFRLNYFRMLQGRHHKVKSFTIWINSTQKKINRIQQTNKNS